MPTSQDDPAPGPTDPLPGTLPEPLGEVIGGAAPAWLELAELAWRAAADAGTLLLARPAGGLAVDTKTTATDVVTQMDVAAEDLITATLLTQRPGDAILGEEGGHIGGHEGTSGVRWVIDPLDGTVNYLYAQPCWAVSIAAEVDGRAVVGVVAAPVLGETFLAVRGAGSYRVARGASPERLAVNDVSDLAHALVATGFGYASSRRAAQSRTLTQVLPQVRDIRRAGAAALDLCWLAAGRVDAYYERGLNPWDHAAGALVAAEAGAVVGGPPDDSTWGTPSVELTWACPVGLAPAFRDLVVGAGAAHD